MTAPARHRAGRWAALSEWLSRQWESRPLLGMRSEPAADRMVRRLALTVGCAGMIAAVLDLPKMLQHRSALGGWATAATIAAFALFPVLAAVAVAGSVRLVRAMAGATAVSYLAAATLVSFSLDEMVPESMATWMFRVFSVAVIAASLAWRPGPAIAYMLAANVVLAFGNLFVVADPSVSWYFGVLFRSIGLCALFLWCSIYAQAGAAAVDEEATAAGVRAARVAGAAARDRERARFAALIHDAVLSTLLDASRAGTESPVLRDQAARTLEQLDALRRGAGCSERFDAHAVSMFLTAAVREADPDLAIGVSCGPGGEALRMPVDVAGTVAAAAVEAVRNSLRHASAGDRVVRRGVALMMDRTGVRVRVDDDGAGFDPHKVPVDRLGLSVSILGRMRSVPGGDAEVVSRPGQGTTVTLSWTVPPEGDDPSALIGLPRSADRPDAGGSVSVGDSARQGGRARDGHEALALCEPSMPREGV